MDYDSDRLDGIDLNVRMWLNTRTNNRRL